ncbi:MAG: electron transfer flavoprotein subunit beta/FixA family protein [Deltaproteobacteria bacterium]|nr:electron transfer flavoprotein subunit beta/FixA family protein [Deltaproteobacteria bacterium]
MKILVPLKRTADPDNANKVKIAPGGGKIVTDGLEPKPNPFDEYAVETALRLTENGTNPKVRLAGDSVVIVSMGPKESAATIRQALAMGADSGLVYETTDEALDGDLVARALARVVAQEKPDLVVMGKQAVDGDSNQVGQILAERLGWPSATFAMSIELSADKKSVIVGREVDGGVIKLKLTLPAVVTVDLRIVSPKSVSNNVTPATHAYQDGARYAPLPMIMAAKKKPIAEAPFASLGEQGLTTTYLRFEQPPSRKAGIKVKDVAELVQRLRSEAKVL